MNHLFSLTHLFICQNPRNQSFSEQHATMSPTNGLQESTQPEPQISSKHAVKRAVERFSSCPEIVTTCFSPETSDQVAQNANPSGSTTSEANFPSGFTVPACTSLAGVAHRMCNRRCNLRIYADPETTGSLVGIVTYGEMVHVLAEQGDWCKISLQSDWTLPSSHSSQSFAWGLKFIDYLESKQCMLQEVQPTQSLVPTQSSGPSSTSTSPRILSPTFPKRSLPVKGSLHSIRYVMPPKSKSMFDDAKLMTLKTRRTSPLRFDAASSTAMPAPTNSSTSSESSDPPRAVYPQQLQRRRSDNDAPNTDNRISPSLSDQGSHISSIRSGSWMTKPTTLLSFSTPSRFVP